MSSLHTAFHCGYTSLHSYVTSALITETLVLRALSCHVMCDVWLPEAAILGKDKLHREVTCICFGRQSEPVSYFISSFIMWMKLSWTLQTSSSASWESLSDLSQWYKEQKNYSDEHFQKFRTHRICEQNKMVVVSSHEVLGWFVI